MSETEERGPAPPDLEEFFRRARGHLDQLFDEYFSTSDGDRAGTLVKLVVRDLSRLDNAREEVLRGSLRKLDDGGGNLGRFDEARDRRRVILGELDDLTDQVRSLDVHASQGAHIRDLMEQLRDELGRYRTFESEDLIPFLEAHLDEEERRELAEQAWGSSLTGPTHVHATKPPADERSGLAKAWTAMGDRLRDSESIFSVEDHTLDHTGRSGLSPRHPLLEEEGS